ncbi:MAG: hypothetical protein AB8B64_16680 [Granulosicoccus sp.]
MPRFKQLCSIASVYLRVCLLTCLPYGALASTPAAVLDRLATPEGASVQMVTSGSVHNGTPIAIATFDSTDSIDSILDFYRHYWAASEAHAQVGFVESELPDWLLISQVRDGYNVVVQLNTQELQGASGFISVMAVNARELVEEHGEFSELKTLSSHRSVDGVDTSLMRVYASSLSVAQTHLRYRQKLIRAGWQMLSDDDIDGARVMVLSRKQSRLELSIVESRHYGSVLVAHEVISR